MQAFDMANVLTTSLPKPGAVAFGGGNQTSFWAVAGLPLKWSQSFTYLGIMFHEDRHTMCSGTNMTQLWHIVCPLHSLRLRIL